MHQRNDYTIAVRPVVGFMERVESTLEAYIKMEADTFKLEKMKDRFLLTNKTQDLNNKECSIVTDAVARYLDQHGLKNRYTIEEERGTERLPGASSPHTPGWRDRGLRS